VVRISGLDAFSGILELEASLEAQQLQQKDKIRKKRPRKKKQKPQS